MNVRPPKIIGSRPRILGHIMPDSFGTDAYDTFCGAPREGSIVLLESPTQSSTELLLHDLIDGQSVSYVSGRSEKSINREHRASQVNPDPDTLEFFDPEALLNTEPDDLDVIIIDGVSQVEEGVAGEALDALADFASEAGAYVFIFSRAHTDTSLTEIRRAADIVSEVSLDNTSNTISHLFAITKNRQTGPMETAKSIQFGSEVTLDASRDIA